MKLKTVPQVPKNIRDVFEKITPNFDKKLGVLAEAGKVSAFFHRYLEQKGSETFPILVQSLIDHGYNRRFSSELFLAELESLVAKRKVKRLISDDLNRYEVI